MQPDLFPSNGLSIAPEAGRKEPRLWLRKLVIWEKPERILREVDLRPGLNIVWSPDPGADDTLPIGHGSGKTTFCRFIRYCLGEESFAPDGQRNAIIGRFPEGHVGAEVMLDGEPWIVLRLLSHRRRDVVIKNGTFAHAFLAKEPTGIVPLRDAIIKSIVGDAGALMPQAIGRENAWDAALAWMARDQECRFSHHLEWRDSESNSHSPVRGKSRDDHLTIVRAFLRALKPEEILESAKEEQIAKAIDVARSRFSQLEWLTKDSKAKLVQVLGGGTEPGVDLNAVYFRALAKEIYERALKLPVGGAVELPRVRAERDTAFAEVNRLTNAIQQNALKQRYEAEIERQLASEMTVEWGKLWTEENPVCPTCFRPLDADHAAHIGISKGAELRAKLRATYDARSKQLEAAKANQKACRDAEGQLKYELAAANQKLTELETRLKALQNAADIRPAAIKQADSIMAEVGRYTEYSDEMAAVAKALADKEAEREGVKGTMGAYRKAESLAIAQLSGHFQSVIQHLSHTEASAEIKLDGNGLSLRTDLGGAAIDSLKVVAFDYAVLMLTIEGKTRLPGFLLHDSPREADLGRSIYNRLFGLIEQLEAVGDVPLFQYVVTTTTDPPEAFQQKPWVCLNILGSPAGNRLMKADL